LITFAAKFAFDSGKKEVLYMADENTITHKAALSIGFVNTGFYKGYEIKNRLLF
jgi:predicted GNAT family acetyltransferase